MGFSKERQESWARGLRWEISLEMKTEHTFVRDQSSAEEDGNEETFLSKREKSLNEFVLKLLNFLRETGQGSHWMILFFSLSSDVVFLRVH